MTTKKEDTLIIFVNSLTKLNLLGHVTIIEPIRLVFAYKYIFYNHFKNTINRTIFYTHLVVNILPNRTSVYLYIIFSFIYFIFNHFINLVVQHSTLDPSTSVLIIFWSSLKSTIKEQSSPSSKCLKKR